MKTILELINNQLVKGLTLKQAEFLACEEIILTKISKSAFANNVLLKGGVVMFNISNNLRRTTSDLDFDFIRYDISDRSIKEFIRLLNKTDPNIRIDLLSISELKQPDYKGKRVRILLKDHSYKVKYKLDMGVHTLLKIKQDYMCFDFDDCDAQFLRVNPPEQIFSEKLISLVKHRVFSTRYKDIFDMYYLITNGLLNKNLVSKCLVMFLSKRAINLNDLSGIYQIVNSVFNSDNYVKNLQNSLDKWMDVDLTIMFKTILDFINSIC